MRLVFNEKKAIQVASFFLEQANNTLNYMKLLKFMYLTERTSLSKFRRPVTYDVYYSLDYGPILSETLDLIKGEKISIWHDYISLPQNYTVNLIKPNDFRELSNNEKKIIEKIFSKFNFMDPFEISAYTHIFPEWQNPKGSHILIEIKDILAAEKKSQEYIDDVIDELENRKSLDELIFSV